MLDQAADSELAGFWTWASVGSSAVCARGPQQKSASYEPKEFD